MFQLFSDPSYHFARRNLQIHTATINDNESSESEDHPEPWDDINIDKLGEQYYAAWIGI
ncbi:hypothetical protein HDU76_005133, partial [Blyttiomyces sp. JEL0837]